MDKENIVERTNRVFEESFEVDRERLTPDAHIFHDIGLDSLDIVDLVVALQQEFGVKIRNDSRIQDVRTLGDIYAFIGTLKTESAGDNT